MNKDRKAPAQRRSKGLHRARSINRAHILAALDEKVPESVICRVLGVGRTAILRTRAAYSEGGLDHALRDTPRPGAPRTYPTKVEAEVAAPRRSPPPPGAKRWTLVRPPAAPRVRAP